MSVVALAVHMLWLQGAVSQSCTELHPFRDVPTDHWAAPAVTQLANQGVLKGYPDSTFRGDRPVTRYELAVALARFAELIEASRTPLLPAEGKKPDASVAANCPEWARDPMKFLSASRLLPDDSPILTDGSKRATAEDVAQALALVAARIIESTNPDPGPTDMP